MSINEKLRTYLDWCYKLCDNLEGNNLKEFAKCFIEHQTTNNISEVLKAEVTEKASEDFRNELDTVSDKLIAYCCGSPILYTTDDKVRNVFHKAIEDLFISIYGELD